MRSGRIYPAKSNRPTSKMTAPIAHAANPLPQNQHDSRIQAVERFPVGEMNVDHWWRCIPLSSCRLHAGEATII